MKYWCLCSVRYMYVRGVCKILKQIQYIFLSNIMSGGTRGYADVTPDNQFNILWKPPGFHLLVSMAPLWWRWIFDKPDSSQLPTQLMLAVSVCIKFPIPVCKNVFSVVCSFVYFGRTLNWTWKAVQVILFHPNREIRGDNVASVELSTVPLAVERNNSPSWRER